AINEAWFGTATPVSGQAKALGGPFTNTKPLTQFLRSPVFLDHSTGLGLLCLVLVPVALAVTRRERGSAAHALAAGAAALLVAELAAIAYYSVTSSWPLWSWYFALTDVVFAAAAASILASDAAGRVLSTTALTRIAAAAFAIAVAITVANLARLDRHGG